jgi:hypothetical protein
MAIGLRRKVRLDSRRATQKEVRAVNAALKRKEGVRRDNRNAALLKAQLAKGSLSATVASWVAVQLGKPASKASQAELQSLAG